MVIRIASAVLTLAGLLALISGVLFWTGTALNLMALHMLLGFLAVGALWVIGVAQAFAERGSWVIAGLRVDRWGGHDRHRHDAVIAYDW